MCLDHDRSGTSSWRRTSQQPARMVRGAGGRRRLAGVRCIAADIEHERTSGTSTDASRTLAPVSLPPSSSCLSIHPIQLVPAILFNVCMILCTIASIESSTFHRSIAFKNRTALRDLDIIRLLHQSITSTHKHSHERRAMVHHHHHHHRIPHQ